MQQSKIIKGSLATIILKLLEDNRRMYGYEMTKAVREATKDKMTITEAALYPTLHKLVADELLETSTETIGGRIRKYYSLTKKGKIETAKKIDILKETINSINLILNTKLSDG